MEVNKYDNLEYVYRFNDEEPGKKANNRNNDLDKDAFLRLLTTQLANQDPLNPIEDREFIAQLAQFTSLEQMQNINKNVEALNLRVSNSIEMMNLNQIQANLQLLKEVTNIRNAMETYLGIESTSIDKEGLKAQIELAYRLEKESYATDSWKLLQDAITTAISVIEDKWATKFQIEDAYNELVETIEGLQTAEMKI